MKYEKTKKDEKKEKLDLQEDRIMVFLKNKDSARFNVGDVLIRQWSYGDNEWQTELSSSTTSTPKKYLYAFENELGIGYLKTFKVNGELAESLQPITEFDLDSNRFVLDPEYADHLILEGEEVQFNPVASFKEKKKHRDRAVAANRKLALSNKPADILAWLDTLKVGDTFNRGYTIPDMSETKYKVLKISTIKVSTMSQWEIQSLNKDFGFAKIEKIKSVEVERLTGKYGCGNKSVLNPTDFIRYLFTNKEPAPLSDNI